MKDGLTPTQRRTAADSLALGLEATWGLRSEQELGSRPRE